jgi:hypothetical protein
MSDTSYDQTGAARQALRDIYRDRGVAGIDDDKLLNQMLPDLLPAEPREAGLLRAAASISVGSLLGDRLNRQMPTESAVRDVAAILVERHAIDQSAALWVVSEYAGVLGHPIAVPPTISPDPTAVLAPGMATAMAGGPGPVTPPPNPYGTQPTQGYPPPGGPAYPGGPVPGGPVSGGPVPGGPLPGGPAPYGGPSVSPEYAPTIGAGTPAGPMPPTAQFPPVSPAGGGGYPPPGGGGYGYPGAYQPQPPRKSKGPLIAGIAVAAVILIVAIVAVALLVAPKGTHKTNATSSHSPTPTFSTTPTDTATATSGTNGVTSLSVLLPHDLDVSTDCQPSTDNADGTVNVVEHYDCTEPSGSTLADAFVFGYQMSDDASFKTSFNAFNKFLNFDPTDPDLDSNCPTDSSHGGVATYNEGGPTTGKVECYDAKQGGYVYVWSDTANRAFMCVVGTKTQTRQQVDDWWKHDSYGHE